MACSSLSESSIAAENLINTDFGPEEALEQQKYKTEFFLSTRNRLSNFTYSYWSLS